RHPGCAVSRAAFTDPSASTSSLVLSGVRVSSGASNGFAVNPAIDLPFFGVSCCYARGSSTSGTIVDHVEIGELDRPVDERALLLAELARLGQVRVRHRRLVGVEERDDDVAIRVVAVATDDRSSERALALGRLLPLALQVLDLVDVLRAHLHDLYEAHS